MPSVFKIQAHGKAPEEERELRTFVLVANEVEFIRRRLQARFVVWLNPFWGPVSLDGKTFEQMKIYQDIKKRIETVVNLPAFTDELFPQDIASMLKSRLTFKEAIELPDHSLMSRHRLKVAQREFYSRLDSLVV